MRVMIHRVRAPMRRFGHARATRDVAEGVIVRVQRDGIEGLGECVPRDYVTGETAETVFTALSQLDLADIANRVASGDPDAAARAIAALDLPSLLRQGQALGLAAACSLELALLDAAHKAVGRPLVATRIARHPLSRTLDTTKSPERFFEERAPGIATVVKVKVGLDRADDVERVRRTRQLGGSAMVLAIDGNMAWTVDEACVMADLLRPYDVAWYEEPLARHAFDDDRRLRARAGIRIMLDESLCSYADAETALASGACDLFNIRLSKNGGFLASGKLVELARRHGIGVQLGTHPGSHAILRAAEWSFAHAIEPLVSIEAVPSGVWFEQELVHEQLRLDLDRSRVVPLDGAGLGITLREDMLDALTVERAELFA
ncbi:MAG TPA: enolase C-terminal domain-like protein [Kofleriaceae bacterium]|jgi:L-alanine-DL-glutamate epimerase-like enolase superfamily enzyme|nr:enolase C-terminal domain-like protein [Kofleriaceae bacterium]